MYPWNTIMYCPSLKLKSNTASGNKIFNMHLNKSIWYTSSIKHEFLVPRVLFSARSSVHPQTLSLLRPAWGCWACWGGGWSSFVSLCGHKDIRTIVSSPGRSCDSPGRQVSASPTTVAPFTSAIHRLSC